MNGSNAKNNWMLHAYADGELAPADRSQLERDIAADAEARAEVEAWRRQKEALKTSFAQVLNEDIPPAIRAALRYPGAGRRNAWYLAGAAVVVVAGVAAYFASTQVFTARSAGEEIAANALSAHRVYAAEIRHAVEVGANEKDHLVTWLSKRVGHRLTPPDLSGRGFELVGGRLLHEDGFPAAQFMYEDGSKRRLTIYVANNPTRRETAFRINEQADYTTCYWLDGPSGYAVAAELPASEMLPIARTVYETMAGAE
jgi:anti-sigma factor RsiW